MKKIEVKNSENKIKMPKFGIFVNGYIINATACSKPKNVIQYNITTTTLKNPQKEK